MEHQIGGIMGISQRDLDYYNRLWFEYTEYIFRDYRGNPGVLCAVWPDIPKEVPQKSHLSHVKADGSYRNGVKRQKRYYPTAHLVRPVERPLASHYCIV